MFWNILQVNEWQGVRVKLQSIYIVKMENKLLEHQKNAAYVNYGTTSEVAIDDNDHFTLDQFEVTNNGKSEKDTSEKVDYDTGILFREMLTLLDLFTWNEISNEPFNLPMQCMRISIEN